MKIYIYACGGYRTADATAYRTYEEAYNAMEADYYDVRAYWEDVEAYMGDCSISDYAAEVYCSGMACDEVWNAVIREQEI